MNKSTFIFKVRGHELDSFGHVNNSVYLQYAETAMWNFLDVNGLLPLVENEGLFPVVMESTQRYIHELRLLDEVRIETELSCSNGLLRYKHNIFNNGTGDISCRVSGKIAFVNSQKILCDVPEAVRKCIEGE